jgi:hypothetical protein
MPALHGRGFVIFSMSMGVRLRVSKDAFHIMDELHIGSHELPPASAPFVACFLASAAAANGSLIPLAIASVAPPRAVQVVVGSAAGSHGGPVLPNSPLGAAIMYCLNQWEALCVCWSDGDRRKPLRAAR